MAGINFLYIKEKEEIILYSSLYLNQHQRHTDMICEYELVWTIWQTRYPWNQVEGFKEKSLMHGSQPGDSI